MLHVSRTTVRSALQSLEQHGVLTRTPRRGTQVYGHMNPSMVALQRLISFARLLEEQGYQVSLSTVVTKTEAPPPEAIEALGAELPAEFYAVERVVIASGKPAIWAIDYFPSRLLARPLRRDRLGQSPFDMDDILVGGPIDNALVELVPRKANAMVVEKLQLKASEAYLLLKETHFSAAGKVLGFSLIHVNDRYVRFQLHRDSGP